MSDRKISVSFKGGSGYEAPLISVGGDTVEDLNFQLDQVLAQGTLERAVALAVRFQQGYVPARRDGAPGAPAARQDPTPSQPSYAQPPQQQVHNQAPPAQASQQHDPWAQSTPQPPAGWNDVPPAADPWGPPQGSFQGQQQQQQAPAPQQSPSGPTPYCQCGQPMEFKNTNNGKPVWRCHDWRWNNGNPTPNHDSVFVDKR